MYLYTTSLNPGLSSYRHLKTVRTHLASLVLPWSADDVVPEHAEKGLTSERWKQMNSDGLVSNFVTDPVKYLVVISVESVPSVNITTIKKMKYDKKNPSCW